MFFEGRGKVAGPGDHGQTPLNTALEDEAELLRASASDPAALAALYRAFGGEIRSFLRRVLPTATVEDADDLCQEVFMRVPKAAVRYRGDAPVKSWLFGIAARVARGRARRQAIRRALWRDRAEGRTVEPTMPDPTRRLEMQRAMGGLSSAHREVLVMTVVENLSAKEVAAALGIREKTVWTRLHRARAALRRGLHAAAEVERG